MPRIAIALVPALLALALPAVPAPAAQALGLGELATAIDHPLVGPTVSLAAPLAFGRVELDASGAEVSALLAGERICGLWLKGPVRFRLRVDDPVSLPVARRNLGELSFGSSVAKTGPLVVDLALEGAVVWGWDLVPLPAGASRVGGAPPEWVARLLEKALFTPPSGELLPAELGLAPGVRYALLHRTGNDLLYVLDPVERRLESLEELDVLDQRYGLASGSVLPREMVSQPVGRAWWEDRPAGLVAEHERISVENPEKELLRISTTSLLRATRDGIGIWRASLLSHVYDSAFERSYPVTVTRVMVGGAPAAFLHQNDELLVALPSALTRGQTVEVTVDHQGAMAQRPGGDSYWSLGTEPWYPQPPLNGELAIIELTVKVRPPFRAFASGDTVSRTTADGYEVLVSRTDRPMQFPVVAAGRYTVEEETRAGRTCRVGGYVFAKARESKRLINNFFGAVEYYEGALATPYPFAELEIVEINDWGFGQAPPGVIFITKEAFNPLSDETSQLFSGGVNGRFLHEIAHGFWGHALKMGSAEEEWLSESFAQYTAALALQAAEGGAQSKPGQRAFEKELRLWKSYGGDVGAGGSIFLANHLAGKDDVDATHRRNLLYFKGPLVLHALRQELGRKLGSAEKGDRAFIVALRAFLKNFDHTWGATRHFIGILDQITGDHWQPWFERYVYGVEQPPVTI